MGFNALALSVLIASPGDVTDARDTVENVIRRWNADRAMDSTFVLLPLRWELNAVSTMGADAQANINEQLVDHADIVVALFNARLGTSTSRAISGTAEEILRAIDHGSRVHVYFSEEPLSRNLDVVQFTALADFKEELSRRGLLGSYTSLDDLAQNVRSALEKDIAALLRGRGSTFSDDTVPEALLDVRCYEAPHERLKDDGSALVLEVANRGGRPAEDVRLDLSTAESTDAVPPVHRLADMTPFTMAPQDVRSFRLYPTRGMSRRWTVTARWTEGTREFSSAHSVTNPL
jgi:hypothetical protein